mmetsp:Transcript_2940/g.6947  ORF Transcript_2940/g.6947 Transcript_2940/m.6947 type:complete len:215 (+) Transcript_2940:242-886(+)
MESLLVLVLELPQKPSTAPIKIRILHHGVGTAQVPDTIFNILSIVGTLPGKPSTAFALAVLPLALAFSALAVGLSPLALALSTRWSAVVVPMIGSSQVGPPRRHLSLLEIIRRRSPRTEARIIVGLVSPRHPVLLLLSTVAVCVDWGRLVLCLLSCEHRVYGPTSRKACHYKPQRKGQPYQSVNAYNTTHQQPSPEPVILQQRRVNVHDTPEGW